MEASFVGPIVLVILGLFALLLVVFFVVSLVFAIRTKSPVWIIACVLSGILLAGSAGLPVVWYFIRA